MKDLVKAIMAGNNNDAMNAFKQEMASRSVALVNDYRNAAIKSVFEK